MGADIPNVIEGRGEVTVDFFIDGIIAIPVNVTLILERPSQTFLTPGMYDYVCCPACCSVCCPACCSVCCPACSVCHSACCSIYYPACCSACCSVCCPACCFICCATCCFVCCPTCFSLVLLIMVLALLLSLLCFSALFMVVILLIGVRFYHSCYIYESLLLQLSRERTTYLFLIQ